jgi:hypothetical protein
MNQTNPHFTQFKNLSKEDQAAHDFRGYKYEKQVAYDWETMPKAFTAPMDDRVYRLVIEPDMYYYIESIQVHFIKLGKDLKTTHNWLTLRPATEAEMPEPATLEDRIKAEYGDYDVVMLDWDVSNCRLIMAGTYLLHIEAQSMRGFYKYVYEDGNDGFYIRSTPIGHDSDQPFAVLFVRGES